MPLKGRTIIKRNMNNFVIGVQTSVTERTLRQVLIVGAANAARLTPVDTSNLINSQDIREVRLTEDGMQGSVIYTANYAAAVHQRRRKTRDGREYSLLKYKKPGAEFGFLTKGFERDGAAEIRRIILNGYKV